MQKSYRWPTGAEVRHKPTRDGAMLYDASRAGNAEASWFDPDWWARRGEVRAAAAGRGAALFIDADNRHLVLRHYRRGGWAARLSTDRYLWRGDDAIRSFGEWHLLYLMRRAALPVPVPIASYRRTGRYTYSAALLTEQIPAAMTLAARLRMAALPPASWDAIGRCLRRFHDDGICHADLNAHNVLVNDAQQPWLIDFDRGRLLRPGFWGDSNLVRLRRSVEKITDALPAAHFCEGDWGALLGGYFAAVQPLAARQ